MEANKINVHPMIRCDVPFTVLTDSTSNNDKDKVLSLINTADKDKDEFASLISSTNQSNEKFKTLIDVLEEWRSNVKNLTLSLENFSLEKLYPIVQKQSIKFVARIEDVVSGLVEYGDQFDISRTVVLVRTERSMLDMDRNKIYMLLFEICKSLASSDLVNKGSDFDTMIADQQRSNYEKPPHADQRVKVQEMELSDGSTYTGEVYNDEPDGEGVRVWPNADDNPTVKPSKYKVKYEGTSLFGKAHGYGQAVFANGDKYEGNWEDNVKNGIGKHTSRKGIVLTGKWLNNYMEGQGKEVWTNGDVYEGEFIRSQKNG